MSQSRSPSLQTFIGRTHAALLHAARADSPARPVIARIFAALDRVGLQARETAGTRLPVCTEFERACGSARRHSPAIAALADRLTALEPRLAWSRRPGAETHGDHFARNHANALIIGEGGLETSADVRIGVSLLAPRTTYPDHRHPPEEVYIALSPGEWRQNDGPWGAPGIGGLVHNPPGILHAMRSAEAPLLAVWCLLIAA